MKEYFKSLIQEVQKTYRENPTVSYLEAAGMLTGLSAAFTLALLGKDANMTFVFTNYFLSSASWLVAAHLKKSVFLLTLNFGFLLVNILGLYNSFVN